VHFAKLEFFHIGVPVNKNEIADNSKYAPLYKMYTQDGINSLGLCIQYHAFDEDSSLDKRVRENVHIAFKVKNIEKTLKGQEVVMPLYEPFKGYRCAIILVNNVLIELVETSLSEEEIWNEVEILKNGILYKNES
jgi:hypothetical protein